MVHLKTHKFVAEKQSGTVHQLKKNLPDGHAIVMMDYAENFNCVRQRTPQFTHWVQKQISILTAMVYVHVDGETHSQSFVVLSNFTTVRGTFQTDWYSGMRCKRFERVYVRLFRHMS